MLFTTATFICLFLPITLVGFFCIGWFSHAGAALWLFVPSVFFYGYWMPEFTLMLLSSIVANFFVGSKIATLVDADKGRNDGVPRRGKLPVSTAALTPSRPSACFTGFWC